jgi:hypothetical protein
MAHLRAADEANWRASAFAVAPSSSAAAAATAAAVPPPASAPPSPPHLPGVLSARALSRVATALALLQPSLPASAAPHRRWLRVRLKAELPPGDWPRRLRPAEALRLLQATARLRLFGGGGTGAEAAEDAAWLRGGMAALAVACGGGGGGGGGSSARGRGRDAPSSSLPSAWQSRRMSPQEASAALAVMARYRAALLLDGGGGAEWPRAALGAVVVAAGGAPPSSASSLSDADLWRALNACAALGLRPAADGGDDDPLAVLLARARGRLDAAARSGDALALRAATRALEAGAVAGGESEWHGELLANARAAFASQAPGVGRGEGR